MALSWPEGKKKERGEESWDSQEFPRTWKRPNALVEERRGGEERRGETQATTERTAKNSGKSLDSYIRPRNHSFTRNSVGCGRLRGGRGAGGALRHRRHQHKKKNKTRKEKMGQRQQPDATAAASKPKKPKIKQTSTTNKHQPQKRAHARQQASTNHS